MECHRHWHQLDERAHLLSLAVENQTQSFRLGALAADRLGDVSEHGDHVAARFVGAFLAHGAQRHMHGQVCRNGTVERHLHELHVAQLHGWSAGNDAGEVRLHLRPGACPARRGRRVKCCRMATSKHSVIRVVVDGHELRSDVQAHCHRRVEHQANGRTQRR